MTSKSGYRPTVPDPETDPTVYFYVFHGFKSCHFFFSNPTPILQLLRIFYLTWMDLRRDVTPIFSLSYPVDPRRVPTCSALDFPYRSRSQQPTTTTNRRRRRPINNEESVSSPILHGGWEFPYGWMDGRRQSTDDDRSTMRFWVSGWSFFPGSWENSGKEARSNGRKKFVSCLSWILHEAVVEG